jgi:hypothetical protein
MARAANATKTKPSAAAGRSPGRSAATTAKAPAKITKATATAKPAPIITAGNAKVSKDELRAQVEKLERANATSAPRVERPIASQR